jgi:hypothetical protein
MMLIPNCLTIEECKTIENRFLQFIAQNPDSNDDENDRKETNFKYHENSFGLFLPLVNLSIDSSKIISRLNRIINQKYSNFVYSHAYLRNYYNGSYLRTHIDREGLDLTLTVNVAGIDTWPIHVSKSSLEELSLKHGDTLNPLDSNFKEICKKISKNIDTITTPRGCGLLIDGRNYPHWRETLHCEEHEYFMQIFFHWKQV